MRTHNIPFSVRKEKITLNYPRSAAMGFFSNRLKKEFETAVVNEPSVFEPLKVYCNSLHCATLLRGRNLIIQKNKQIPLPKINK